MIRGSLAYYIEWFLEDIQHGHINEYSIEKVKTICRKMFKGIMPTHHWIFPITPKVYVLSKTLCLEFPSFGSYTYRDQLNKLYDFLEKYFITDKISFDGKVTYQIRGVKYDH